MREGEIAEAFGRSDGLVWNVKCVQGSWVRGKWAWSCVSLEERTRTDG